ncbi:MAG: transglycosylase SLT domain-containing protein [Gemmatimonadales bacterium]
MHSIIARSIVVAGRARVEMCAAVLLCAVPTAQPKRVLSATLSHAADSAAAPRSIPPAALTSEDSSLAEGRLTALQTRRSLQGYFARFSEDRVLVRRVAQAVALEAKRQHVSPSLIAAVVVTENTTLTPAAQSSVGALGLMQVMPMHAGQLGCQSNDLEEIESNICHGTKILSWNLRSTKSPFVALLRYNGCVKGTNTPDCRRYPVRVLARAGRVRQEMLAAYAVAPAPATAPRVLQLAQR